MYTNNELRDILSLILSTQNDEFEDTLGVDAIELKAFKLRAKRWIKNKNIVGYDVGIKKINGKKTNIQAIRFYVDKKIPRNEISRPIPRNLKLNGLDLIPTDVIVDDSNNKSLTYPPIVTLRAGFSIGNARFNESSGTIAFFAYDLNNPKNYYAITAAHILARVKHLPMQIGSKIMSHSTLVAENNQLTSVNIGELRDYIFDFADKAAAGSNDVAIIKIHSNIKVSNLLVGTNLTIGQAIRQKDLQKYTKITFFGSYSRQIYRGFIKYSSTGPYPNLTGLWMKDMIQIIVEGKNAEEGDSGALITTLDGNPIGILCAKYNEKIFVMSIERIKEIILSRFNINLSLVVS